MSEPRYISDLSREDQMDLADYIHQTDTERRQPIWIDHKVDPRYPSSHLRVEDSNIEVDLSTFIDLKVGPPPFIEPGISVKKNGITKINKGLIGELKDAGGFVYFHSVGLVTPKLIGFIFFNSEGLIKHWEKQKEIDDTQTKDKVTHLRDSGKKIGIIHLGSSLRHAEFDDRSEIEEGTLIPDEDLFTSRDFGLSALTFDRSRVDKGMLIVILDPKKGSSHNRTPFGRKEQIKGLEQKFKELNKALKVDGYKSDEDRERWTKERDDIGEQLAELHGKGTYRRESSEEE